MPHQKHDHPPLFSVPSHSRDRTSDVLLMIIDASKQSDVTLRKLTERLGDRTFGMLLILVTSFSVIPFVATLVGLIVMMLGAQMAVGMTKTWLPKMILDRELPANKVRTALGIFEPKIRKIEKYLRPRWQITEAPIVDRINGVMIVILGAIMTIPIPLTNLAPAFAVVLLGLGLMERDGLVQSIAASFGVLALGIVYYLVFM